MKDETTITSAALRQAVGVILNVMDEYDLDEDVAQTAAEGFERICRRYSGAAQVPSDLEGRDALNFLVGELADLDDETND